MYKDKIDVGGRILRCREKAGISQRRLGEIAKKEFKEKSFSWQSVSKWEKEEVMPKAEHLHQLAIIFDVKVSWLLTGLRTRNDMDNKLLNNYHQLKDTDKSIIDSMIKSLKKQQKPRNEEICQNGNR